MTPDDAFREEVAQNIEALTASTEMRQLGIDFVIATAPYRYSYNFRWMGRPIIQFPQDMLALQELVWRIRPQVIVETGVAHGGSLVFHASMLTLLGDDGFVVGIDVDIRPHNRKAIEEHPMAPRIRLVEGSSTDPSTLERVFALTAGRGPILVILDSNHTHEHVLAELETYSPLVQSGSYLVVLDTVIEQMPKSLFPDRPWGPGNSPGSAVQTFLNSNDRFELDEHIDGQLLITVAPKGWLRCIKDSR